MTKKEKVHTTVIFTNILSPFKHFEYTLYTFLVEYYRILQFSV